MTSIALDRGDVIVGVDTHKDQHVAVAIDGVGGLLDQPKFIDASNDGYGELLAWARSLGKVHVFAVEGCGSYGIGLARFLCRHGHPPVEVSRPPRAGARRMSGKSDAIDAEHAARSALADIGAVTPKLADGRVEAIRLVKIARDTAVKAHTTAMITLKAVLVTAGQDLRDELEPLSDFRLVTACSRLDTSGHLADPAVAMRHTLRSLARRWFDLHGEIKTHSKHLKALTRAAAPELLAAFGVGLDCRCADPDHRRRQRRPSPKRDGLRQDVWGRAHPHGVRQDERSPSTQPGREPPSQRRALPGGHRPDALARADHRLRRATHRRRALKEGRHPMPEALPRP